MLFISYKSQNTICKILCRKCDLISIRNTNEVSTFFIRVKIFGSNENTFLIGTVKIVNFF